MSAKLATLGLLKIKVFERLWRLISVNDVIYKILSRDSSYIVDVVVWRKFGNPSISMKEVTITVIL